MVTSVLILVGCGGKSDRSSGLIGIRGKLGHVAPALRVRLAIVKSVFNDLPARPFRRYKVPGLYHGMTLVAVTKWEHQLDSFVQEELL